MCSRLAIPLLLEPLGFPGEPHGPGTIAAVTATMPLGATVMKVAWPGEDHLGLACRRVAGPTVGHVVGWRAV